MRRRIGLDHAFAREIHTRMPLILAGCDSPLTKRVLANYEWTVVHTIEKLRSGFLNKWRFAKNPMTAGTVGKKFKNAVSESSDLARPLASNLKEAGRAFMELADERNELVHAHVYSEPDGRQQLVYHGKDKTRTWSVTEIDDLAHRFENSSIALRDLMKEI